MPKIVTDFDRWSRERFSRWVTPLTKKVSSYDLDAAFRKAKACDSESDYRSTIRAWVRGDRTIWPANAFAIGEALRELHVPTCGLDAAYVAGHTVDVGRALVLMGNMKGGDLPALALYVALPLGEHIRSLEQLASQDALQYAREVGARRDALVRPSLSSVGKIIERAWANRDEIGRGGKSTIEQEFFAYASTRAHDPEIAQSLTWRFLAEWALIQATRLSLDDLYVPLSGLPEDIELGILALSLQRISSTSLSHATKMLVEAVLARFESGGDHHFNEANLLPQTG